MRKPPAHRLTHEQKKARLDKGVELAQKVGVEEAAKEVGLSPRYIYIVCRERMVDVKMPTFHLSSFKQIQIAARVLKSPHATLDSIGQEVGVTREYVRLVKRAMKQEGMINED